MKQEIKSIHNDVGWYASYEESDQGKALILCQQLKIIQLMDVMEIIKGEIELTENPQEYSHEAIIESIKFIITTLPKVSYEIGHFKWEE